MSNEQIIQGIIKFGASSKYAKNDRMNAVISTTSGEVRAWASVGSPEGQILEGLRKGQTAQIVVDGKGNFLRLANAPAPPVQATNGQPMYQNPAPVQSPAPGVGLQQVSDRGELMAAIYNDLKNRLSGEFPVDQEFEIITSMAKTIYISLT